MLLPFARKNTLSPRAYLFELIDNYATYFIFLFYILFLNKQILNKQNTGTTPPRRFAPRKVPPRVSIISALLLNSAL